MIPLIRSTFYKEKETKKRLIDFISQADKLSFGEECEKFEKNFAKWQGRKYCIFLNSGSSANLGIIQALLNLGRIKRGEMVAFSALTWSTNVMPLIELGLKPIPVDVELTTLNISSKTFREVIKKFPIKLLFITNLLGFCHDIDEIRKICHEEKIILLEDNCESLGTIYKGKKLGNFGIASTFSFYVGHHMSTIEGGVICTNDEEIVEMIQLVRAHGWDRNLSPLKQTRIRNNYKINSTFYSRYTFYDLGYNLRPTEINGFIGNTQLQYLDEIIRKRNENFLIFSSSLYKLDTFYEITHSHIELLSNFAIPLVCKSKKIRDYFAQKCKDRIEIRPIVGGNITQQPFYKKYMSGFFSQKEKSNSSLIHEQGLYFGNNPELTKKEIFEIINIFSS